MTIVINRLNLSLFSFFYIITNYYLGQRERSVGTDRPAEPGARRERRIWRTEQQVSTLQGTKQ